MEQSEIAAYAAYFTNAIIVALKIGDMDRVAEFRERQREFARRIGVSQNQLKRIAKGA